jgi:hypothetical protein
MKKPSEPKERAALLEGVLADEDWQALNLALKQDALAVLGARKRQRRWFGQAATLGAIALGFAVVVWSSRRPGQDMVLKPGPSSSAATAGPMAQFISEQEMLALFPAGSCVLAEIDGKKQLVFFDPQEAKHGFELPLTGHGL